MDDFPLAICTRRFLSTNQFAYDHVLDNYGDYVLVNGTLSPQVTLPRQWVRLRILNADVARGYNLGFSDNLTFYVIGNDCGLLDAPIAVTRAKLMVGERIEIMVNLGGDTIGSSLDLRAFNSGQVFGFPGQEGNPTTPTGNSGPQNGSLLNNTDFNVLHLVVGAASVNPVTSLPTTLIPRTYWTTGDVTNTRAINIIARSGGTEVSSNGLAASYESGWKDTIYVPRNETVSVIAKFDDFASNTNPFMFHCHFLQHEDGGMMGQFRVVNIAVEDLAVASFTRTGSNDLITLNFKATAGTTYTLQYSPDMTTGSWTDIGSVTSDGTSANFTETDAARLAMPRGFYRVTIPAIP